MCLILVAWHAHPDYPLVLAANRDEFHARATAAAAWWPEPAVLAGRDLQAGGTWLGVSRDGRFAALTNYRDPGLQRSDAPSRGEWVPSVLQAALPAARQLQRLATDAPRYNGFNLIFSDGEQLAVYESVSGRGQILPAGVYGLSNHLLDSPWPKVEHGKSALAAALLHLPQQQPLLELLRDEQRPDDAQLPRTGISLEWERLLSSAFIRAPNYGTRCSTLVLLDRHGRLHFEECSWDREGDPAGSVAYDYQCEPSALVSA